ncbi:hypothetical protein TanjilG_05262 [Lupinus angustifolius]|uniref:Nuclear factor related to kappa-B-binding protein n=1 Tax=Lupinus angustifolius TaxID=3871 RepID=A0A4P1RAY8_LUPAN|nr:hypothetical protein TanjilG_05262 [Lupinus angustifolius]
MAADQKRKRLNGASIIGYGYREQNRTKRKNLGPAHNDLSMKSHIAIEWDANQKRVVSKPEQIGISWRHMKPFVSFVSEDHNVLADVFTIPEEIFDLVNLTEVLSYELGRRYKKGKQERREGHLHPDVIIDREQHLKSEKRAYYSQLHNYHKEMIGFLTRLKKRWQSSKYPEKEIAHKMWRSRNDVEKIMPSSVNGSRLYNHDGNLTLTTGSCSWDAEDRACSSDNQISSLRKDDKLQRRVLEKGIVKGKSRNLIYSSDDILNVGERPNKGDKLPKHNIHSSEGDKYMSCIKISKQQHELVKNMKQLGKSIQSRSLNRVLGNLDNIHVQPYEVFLKEEQKKLHEHWLEEDNVNSGSDLQDQDEDNMSSGSELQDQDNANSGSKLQDQGEDNMSSGNELQDQDDDNVSSGNSLPDQKEDSVSSGGELQDEDNVDSGSKLQDKDEYNTSSGSELRDQVGDTGLNAQSSSKDDEDSIGGSPENQSPYNSHLRDELFIPVSMGSEKNIVSSKQADASPNKVEYSRNMNNEDISINEGSSHNTYLRGESLNPVSMGSEKNIVSSRNMNTQDVSINEGAPFASSIDVWQEFEMPHSSYDSAVTHEYIVSGLSLGNPQVNEEQRTNLIDLQADLRHQETGKVLSHRQLGDGTFNSCQSQDQNNFVQSLFKGEEMLSYHPEQKGDKLDFKPSNNVMMGDGQFSSHFKEPLQRSLTLDQGQRRASEVYLPVNMSDNIYSDRGRYLISRQDPLISIQHPLPAANVNDWAANTARIAAPPQSHLNNGNFIGHHWFPADHVRGGWNVSDGSSASCQSLGTQPNTDQNLFSIVSHSNQLRLGSPYDSVRNSNQFLAPRTHGELDAAIPRPNEVVPQASHAPGYFSGHEATGGQVPNDMAQTNLPHQNSALHDQIGPSYLRSWNQP